MDPPTPRRRGALKQPSESFTKLNDNKPRKTLILEDRRSSFEDGPQPRKPSFAPPSKKSTTPVITAPPKPAPKESAASAPTPTASASKPSVTQSEPAPGSSAAAPKSALKNSSSTALGGGKPLTPVAGSTSLNDGLPPPPSGNPVLLPEGKKNDLTDTSTTPKGGAMKAPSGSSLDGNQPKKPDSFESNKDFRVVRGVISFERPPLNGPSGSRGQQQFGKNRTFFPMRRGGRGVSYPRVQPRRAVRVAPLPPELQQRLALSTARRNQIANPFRWQGTVVPAKNFDAVADARVLRAAMKGLGTDEKTIINIICKRSSNQRQLIRQAFQKEFDRDLMQDLRSELSFNFRRVIIGLMEPLHEYLAREANKAIVGLGTDNQALIEILCAYPSTDVQIIKHFYQTIFNTDLRSDVEGDTSGNFRRILLALLDTNREAQPAELLKARYDAFVRTPSVLRNRTAIRIRLFDASIARWGPQFSTYIDILVRRSYAHLRYVFHQYRFIAKESFQITIKREASGDFMRAMLCIVQAVENLPLYFSESLYKSMKGLGTTDVTLIRIIVTRCELDMVQIQEEFDRTYKKGGLIKWIEEDTSGDYREALVTLVRGNRDQ